MSEFSLPRLLTLLDELLINRSSLRLCVSLSGGLDSMVLLHALAQLRSEHRQWQMRAIHVNHQLQSTAGEWAQLCVNWCDKLDVPCTVLAVDVTDIKELGTEAAARKARYAALQAELKPDEILLTAHHADDQLETVLIALMRGSGLDGLAAMPSLVRFAHAWHARPLLGFTRDALHTWADQQSLSYINDPSNAHTDYDRNFLRHEIVPRLKQRWPSSSITGARAAAHLSDVQSLLDQYVGHDLDQVSDDNTLHFDALRHWPSARRRAVIRSWLAQNDVLMPSTRVLQSLEHDMLRGADDRVPCTRWDRYAVHRYQGRLYLEKIHRPEQLDESMPWNWQESLQLPHQLGLLCMVKTTDPQASSLAMNASKLPPQLSVQFRHGGEQIQLPGESIHRELKKLLQDVNVLPWWRGRVPFIYAGDDLVAVANLWVSANYVATDAQPALRLQWLHDKISMIYGK